MVCIGILLSFHIIIQYTVPQYVISGLIMFVSAEVLEGNTFLSKFDFLFFFVMIIAATKLKHLSAKNGTKSRISYKTNCNAMGTS